MVRTQEIRFFSTGQDVADVVALPNVVPLRVPDPGHQENDAPSRRGGHAGKLHRSKRPPLERQIIQLLDIMVLNENGHADLPNPRRSLPTAYRDQALLDFAFVVFACSISSTNLFTRSSSLVVSASSGGSASSRP